MPQRNQLKEKTTSLRSALKSVGISARVRMDPARPWIRVEVKSVSLEFSDAEQRTIRQIAKDAGLTHIYGAEIVVDRMTNPRWHLFVIPEPAQKKVTKMSNAEFVDHMNRIHETMARIETGIMTLKADYDMIEKQLAALRPN